MQSPMTYPPSGFVYEPAKLCKMKILSEYGHFCCFFD